MNAELLRELQDRGRFFYERFPGAAAAEAWTRVGDRAGQEHTTVTKGTGLHVPTNARGHEVNT